MTNKARTNELFARVLRVYKLYLSVNPEQVINRT
jgi:hypothetical protein